MADIGILTPVEQRNSTNTAYEGHIQTLLLDLSIRLIVNQDKRSSQAPDFVVEGHARNGNWPKIGAAWWKETKRGDDSLIRYISVSISDPSMPETLHCAAFLEDGGDRWVITWRPRGPAGQNTPSRSRGAAQSAAT